MTEHVQSAGLLPAQESHWELMCGLSPDAPGASRFIVVDSRFIDAPMDYEAVKLAFADVTRRQDALRLVFDTIDYEPRMRIEAAAEPQVEYLDLSALGTAAQHDRIAELVYWENNRSFDLLRGPAWHAWFVRLAADRHFLNVCLSEAIADGWATKALVEDLLAGYAAHVGTAAPPEPALSFAQMDAIQRHRMEPSGDRLEFWRERLLPLPDGSLFQARTTARTSVLTRDRIDVTFTPELLATLSRRAWQSRTTVYMVLMAAYHALLSLETGQERTVLSTVTLGRASRRERRSPLPCTVDPYVVTTLTPGTSLHEAIRRTHAAMVEAMSNLVPYTSLARAINPAFDSQRPWPDSDLCHGNFYAAAFGDSDITLAGMRVRAPLLPGREPAGGSTPTLHAGTLPSAQQDVWTAYCGPSMEVYPERDGCALIYNGEMYAHEEMKSYMDSYLWVVEEMAASPETTMRELSERYALRDAR
ncbi:condensation domain-containing protein [Actinomadura syzygii]|uniref:Condensation domain-containing protein n=1 Tax=Actinomadura syzygii TaxID=1427538 RepID=A0A5D0TY86_9ACTN|nr:condensation domain-containing protein [Actinomadura syzygii]TYC10336.1 hypothetical protein FXF65_30925 [Actinomadura syzygii]